MLLSSFGKNLCPGLLPGKTGRMIKTLSFFLLAGCLQLSARTSAQGISISLNNAGLGAAFDAIQQQTAYHFIYTSEQLAAASKITINVKHGTLDKILEVCFRDQPLSYSIEDNFIIIKAKEKKINAPPVDTEVKGKVMNERDEPVAGASVIIKGGKKGTATNEKGEFSLSDVSMGSIVIVTSVGYESKEIPIGNNRVMLIHLQSSVSGLDEMVVKGYYTTTKRLNTGSVSKVSAKEIEKQPVNNPLGAIEGRMAGVVISQSSGVPGTEYTVQIRGQNSLRSQPTDNGNLPLYIINGVPFSSISFSSNSVGGSIVPNSSPLSTINPYDIESIEVLKDADATSIYGSRGSNGVVLITTKKGKSGRTKVDVNIFEGIGEVAHRIKLLNTREYLTMRREAFINDKRWPVQTSNYTSAPDLFLWDTTRYTDWQQQLTGRISHLTSMQAAVSGGTANTQFLIGGGYYKETAVIPGNFADQKGSAHLNINHTSDNQKFKISFSSNYVSDNNQLPSFDPTTSSLTLPPDAPEVFHPDGTLNWQNSQWTNPYSNLLIKYKGITNNLISNAILSYEPLSGLVLKTNLGYNTVQVRENSTAPISSKNPAFFPTGNIVVGNKNSSTWIVEPQLEYQHRLYKGKIIFLIGSTLQQNTTDGQVIIGAGFTNDALLGNIQAAPILIIADNTYSKYKYTAGFARVHYNLLDRYLINFTARRDGSSRFGTSRQFANFGAIGLGWIFSSESWMKHLSKIISYGKLRTSFGTSGSDQIGDYGYLATYSTTDYPYNGTPGLTLSRLPNASFSWEKNKKLEIAFELGFFKDKILMVAGWYQNRSSNQLVGYALPSITGQTSIQANFPATVQNNGLEIEVNTANIKKSRFSWTSSFNISIPRNKLVAYPDLESSSYNYTYRIGEPLNIVYGNKYGGVDPLTGLYQFSNKDGKLTSSPVFPDDFIYTRTKGIKYYGALGNEINFHHFELFVLFQFVEQTGQNYIRNFAVPGAMSNQPIYVMQRWTQQGDITDVQKFTTRTNNSFRQVISSDKILEDASFIRLKNLSLAYHIPIEANKSLNNGASLKIYIQCQNLFTITGYKGLDPENQNASSIPPLRVISTGIQFIF